MWFYEPTQTWVGALKRESVVGTLHWFSQITSEQIESNCAHSLLEAALHPDPNFHRMVLRDVMRIKKFYNINQFKFIMPGRETILQCLSHYCRYIIDNMTFYGEANKHLLFDSDFSKPDVVSNSIPTMDPKSHFNNVIFPHLTKHHNPPNVTISFSNNGDNPHSWVCTIKVNEANFVSAAATKKQAEQNCFSRINKMFCEGQCLIKKDDGMLEPAIANSAPMTPMDLVVKDEPTTTRGRAAMNASAPSASTVPGDGLTPPMENSMAGPMQAVDSNMSEAEPIIFMPTAPLADLVAGAVPVWNMLEFIMEQWVLAGSVTITNEHSPGTVIFSIPYAINNNPYLSGFAKDWANLHKNMEGLLETKILINGSTSYLGLIQVSWYPTVPPKDVSIAQLQMYPYVTVPLNQLATRNILTGDKRMRDFVREIDQPGDDISDRPHVVICIVNSLSNPFQPEATVDLNIYSRCSQMRFF
jgi:hypothetical protein